MGPCFVKGFDTFPTRSGRSIDAEMSECLVAGIPGSDDIDEDVQRLWALRKWQINNGPTVESPWGIVLDILYEDGNAANV